jgi:hypothetical protein
LLNLSTHLFIKQVVTQIERVMQNYKLKDNLKLSYDLIENNKKEEARGMIIYIYIYMCFYIYICI